MVSKPISRSALDAIVQPFSQLAGSATANPTRSAKAARAALTGRVLEAMEEAGIPDLYDQQRTRAEWIKYFLDHNIADSMPETWRVSKIDQFRQDFDVKANDLRWMLLYWRRHCKGDIRTELKTGSLVKKLSLAMRSWQDSKYKNLAQQVRQSGASPARLAMLGTRGKSERSRGVGPGLIDSFLGTAAPALPDDVLVELVNLLCALGLLKTSTDGASPSQSQLSALHHALNDFLDVSDPNGIDFANVAEGNYLLFRPSQHSPGHIVRGHVKISKVYSSKHTGSPTLLVTESYRHGQNEHAGIKAFEERYIGVMCKKAGQPFMVTCLQLSAQPNDEQSTKVESRGAPRFALFPLALYGATESGTGIYSMTGISVSPFAGGHAFALPLCLERTDLAVGQASLGVYLPSEVALVPLTIQARLERGLGFSVASTNFALRPLI
jgi:hypothetical protein